MIYLYDVWVNWVEDEECGYNVFAFHEWRNSDKIEILEQVPVLYISEALFESIENGLHDLPESLLTKIYRKSYIRTGHKREVLTYVGIVSDGRGILAFDTKGYQSPIRKSRLIPKQEQRILDLIHNEKCELFKCNLPQVKQLNKFTLSVEQVYGLTRRERTLKQILMTLVYRLRHTNNKNELIYWLSEWYIPEHVNILTMSKEQMWHYLYSGVKRGWSKQHEFLCAQMVRGNEEFERIFNLEQLEGQNISK